MQAQTGRIISSLSFRIPSSRESREPSGILSGDPTQNAFRLFSQVFPVLPQNNLPIRAQVAAGSTFNCFRSKVSRERKHYATLAVPNFQLFLHSTKH